MARWLTSRFPRDCEVAWARFEDTERLDETLSLRAAAAEGDAFSDGGIGWRAWLRVAKGGRRMTDLQLLVELFERTGLPEETRDWLYESLALPVLWRPRGVGASRTLARVSPSRLFFHADGLERHVAALGETLAAPLPSLRPAPRGLAESLIDAARVARATRQRELHAFSHPNPDDVLLADGDRGVRLAFIGIQPGFRLPLEGYYAFLALKRLAGAEVYLTLPGGHPEPEKRLRATDVSALVARLIAREFGGDRLAAVRESTARVRRALGVASWTAWPTAERRAFAQMSPVAGLITDLEKWTAAERRHLLRVLRAKGSGSERAYANLLDSHRRVPQRPPPRARSQGSRGEHAPAARGTV